jgi:hypothetical protein
VPSTSSSKPVIDSLRQPWRSLWERPGSQPARATATRLGDGQPALVFPMFGAGGESTARLRQALNRAGFRCHDWGYGPDTGPRSGTLHHRLRRIEEALIDVFEADREAVTLIGWGLSGLYAREVAKRAAPLVRQVITLGTPFNCAAGECEMLRPLYGASGRVPAALVQQLREQPPVPCTSIYSMSDSAVPWQMSVDIESATSENVLVSGVEHRDLADHPKVREVIADRLAQASEDWRPFAT